MSETNEGAVVAQQTGEGDPPIEGGTPDQWAQRMFAAWQQGGPGGVNPDVARKVTSEHISTALANQDKGHARWMDDRKGDRLAAVGVIGLTIVAIVSIVFLLVLTNNAAVLADHFDAIVTGIAGAFGGYGVGRSRAA